MDEITINIDCYQCKARVEIPFDLTLHTAEYGYCPDCKEGVQVCFNNGVLSIDRLPELYS